MDLNVAGSPGQASGDFEDPVLERRATPELTGGCCHERADGMEKIGCGQPEQEEKGFVCGKAGGGVGPLRVLGCLPKLPRFMRLVEDRVTGLRRVLAVSLVFVVLDPMPNDLETPNEDALECPVRNERRGRSPLARGQKILRLGGDAWPPNRQISRTRLRLKKRCNPEPRFSGLWVTLVACEPSSVTRTIVFRASR
jgi:hypothetical protein